MRELDYDFDKGFVVGLRKHHKNPRNNQALIEALNLRVGSGGLEPYVDLTTPFDAVSMDWPYPCILEGDERSYVAHRDLSAQSVKISLIDSSFDLTQVFEVDDATYGSSYSRAEMADFNLFQVIVLGNATLVYNPASGTLLDPTSFGVSIPKARTCCAFRGQLILGNITSTWHGCDKDSVVWSGIGSADCTPGGDNVAGFRKLSRGGEVFSVKELGKSVIVYSDREIAALIPVSEPAPTFALEDLLSIGIVSKHAVGGDEHHHLFVDRVGWLWELTKDGNLTKHGYQEFMSLLNPADIVISYDRFGRDFYISDGVRCFLFSEQGGLTEVHQLPLSIADLNGQLVSIGGDSGEREGKLVVDTFDFGFRPLKTIFTLEFGCHGGGSVQCAIDYRTERRHDFYRTDWTDLNNLGIVSRIIAGNDFRVALHIGDPTTFHIDYFKIRWKMTDMRNVRGLPGLRGGA